MFTVLRASGEEPPRLLYSLEGVFPVVFELEARSGDEIGDGAGDQYFTRSGERRDSCACGVQKFDSRSDEAFRS
jgi:hypothetical protein